MIFAIRNARKITIPVLAHNQFRFDFFLFLKGIRPNVWETPEIGGIGGIGGIGTSHWR